MVENLMVNTYFKALTKAFSIFFSEYSMTISQFRFNSFRHVYLFLFLSFFLHTHAESVFASQATVPNLSADTQKDTPASNYKIGYIEFHNFLDSEFDTKQIIEEYFSILKPYYDKKFDFVAVDYEYPQEALSSGQVNIMPFMSKELFTPTSIIYSEDKILTTNLYIVTNDKNDVGFEDINAMQGKSIAVYALDNSRDILDIYLENNNINMHYKIYKNFKSYINSSADFHVVNSFYFLENKQIIARIGSQSLYFAATSKDETLLKELNKAHEQAQLNSSDKLEEFYQKYIDKTSETINAKLSKNEATLLERPSKVAQAAYLTNHYPIQFKNENDQPAGITIDVIKLFERMHASPTDFIGYTLNDEIDITKFDILFSIVGNRKERKDDFYKSNPYLELPMIIFKRSNLESKGKKINFGMLDYSTISHKKVQSAYPLWNLRTYSTFNELLSAYKEKRIDAILISNVEDEYIISQLGISGYDVFATPLHLPFVFYLSKRYPVAALNVLNAYIEQLNPQAVQQAVMKADIYTRAPVTILEWMQKYSISLLIVFCLGGTLLVTAYVIYIKRNERILQKTINTDSLTGLSSLSAAYKIIKRTLQYALPNQYTLVTLDIDKFSLLNQVYGHEKADELLCHFASLIKSKYVEKHQATCVARVRDDVFLVFSKTANIERAFSDQKFTKATVSSAKELLHSNYNISISRGCYTIEDVSIPIETMIDYCQAARTKGKSTHGITTNFFSAQMKKTIETHKEILYKMENAVENNEFVLAFQPKVDLKSKKICGAEVLVRWLPHNAPIIYPDAFIPVFEANAFIAQLDMYVFEKTCIFIQKYRNSLPLPPLAINLSGITVLHDETADYIVNTLKKYNVEPHEIDIEITESALVAESGTFLQAIENFNNLGFRIAIDDFGTGVSSLHRLSTLQVDVVKLDKAFLEDKLVEKKGIILVSHMITMLHRLDMHVIAEGVETETHVDLLRQMGCDIAQGYYFYKALLEEDFLKKLRTDGDDFLKNS